MCSRNYTTVKRAFSTHGVSNTREAGKPLKEHTEEKVFACLMNWIIQQMKGPDQVTIRYKVGHTTYEMRFSYRAKQVRVSVPKVVSTDENFILYDWAEGDKLINLTVEKINASVQRTKNKRKEIEQNAQEPDQETSTEPCANSEELDQWLEDLLGEEA